MGAGIDDEAESPKNRNIVRYLGLTRQDSWLHGRLDNGVCAVRKMKKNKNHPRSGTLTVVLIVGVGNKGSRLKSSYIGDTMRRIHGGY